MTVAPAFLSACLEAGLVAKSGAGLGLRHKLQLAIAALQVGVDGPLRDQLVRLLSCPAGSVSEQHAGRELLAQVDYANRAPVAEAPRGRADLE